MSLVTILNTNNLYRYIVSCNFLFDNNSLKTIYTQLSISIYVLTQPLNHVQDAIQGQF